MKNLFDIKNDATMPEWIRAAAREIYYSNRGDIDRVETPEEMEEFIAALQARADNRRAMRDGTQQPLSAPPHDP